MCQEAFHPELFLTISPCLILNWDSLTVLIDSVTGNNVVDHCDYALWLGKKLDLNIAFLKSEYIHLI